MKEVLVTGCHGQLGSELQKLAPAYADSCHLHFTDRDELDITDRKAVFRFVEEGAFSVIVNCAAFTAVDRAENEAEACDLVNHIAPGYLAEAVAAVGGTIVQISTDYVFDGTSCRPYREDDHTHPQTVYGRTKLMGEESVVRLCPGAMIIRTGWLYSTFGNNFVKTMLRLGRERKELGVVADQVGTPTYARDLADAIMHVVDGGVLPGIYHYANEGVTSWFDFAHAIHRAAGIDEDDCRLRPLHTEEYPVPAKRPHYSVLDKTKIKQTYGLSIPWWEDSLRECIKKL